MTKWGQKPKPKKIPRPSNPKKCLYQKSTPKKTHVEFPNLEKFQKALNDMAWKIKTLEIECLWTFLYSSYYLKLSWIFILFWRPKSLLKSSHPKNACQIFLPKNISGLKFQTPQILLSSSRESGLPTLGLYLYLILSAWDFVEYNHCKTISPSKISLKHDTMNWFIWTEWRWTARTMV